jgi:hypothetical protein
MEASEKAGELRPGKDEKLFGLDIGRKNPTHN